MRRQQFQGERRQREVGDLWVRLLQHRGGQAGHPPCPVSREKSQSKGQRPLETDSPEGETCLDLLRSGGHPDPRSPPL